MFNDSDIVFDDQFVRDNLSFLLEDEYSGITKFKILCETDTSIKDVISKLECSMNLSWSSSSSGSICSIKEESTKYVNVCLSCDKLDQKPTLSLETLFNFDFDVGDTNNSFTDDFPSNSTSTPTKQKDKAALNGEQLGMKSRREVNSNSETSKPNKVINDSNSSPESKVICKFCLKNGESEFVYSSHAIKRADGTVVCPILKKYVCELCGATGKNAHTRKYCPLYKKKFQPQFYTRRLSNGVVVSRFNHK